MTIYLYCQNKIDFTVMRKNVCYTKRVNEEKHTFGKQTSQQTVSITSTAVAVHVCLLTGPCLTPSSLWQRFCIAGESLIHS